MFLLIGIYDVYKGLVWICFNQGANFVKQERYTSPRGANFDQELIIQLFCTLPFFVLFALLCWAVLPLFLHF